MTVSPLKGFFLVNTVHEDEAQDTGWLYVPLPDGRMEVRLAHNCEEYEGPSEFMTKAEARAHWVEQTSRPGWEEGVGHYVRDDSFLPRLPWHYYPDLLAAYEAARAGCKDPSVSPWKEACKVSRSFADGKLDYEVALDLLRSLR